MGPLISRRNVLGGAASLAVLGLAACTDPTAETSASTGGGSNLATEGSSSSTLAGARTFAAEWDPHQRTYMSWPNEEVWGKDLAHVRAEIADVANAIAEFEEVVLLASPGQEASAKALVTKGVQILSIPVDDLWARDIVPVFVESGSAVSGIDLNFNGWGNKQTHANDAKVAQRLLDEEKIPRIGTWLVGEGGSLETDGQGTLLVTKSSLINKNRNPGKSQQQIEDELKSLLGLKKVIWFDGVAGHDITDAHVDSLARFVAPGVVLLDTPGVDAPEDVWSKSSDQARGVLESSQDATGKDFQIIDLPQPDFSKIRGTGEEFLASYVNFFVGNGVVLMPEFGDKTADQNAKAILQEHFSDREVVQLDIDTIASGGGGIHCATHDQPKSAA